MIYFGIVLRLGGLKKKKLTIALCCCFLLQCTFAQSIKTDSLLNLLQTATDLEKIDLYNEIGLSYRGTSFTQVKNYSIKSYQLAKEKNLSEKMIISLSNIAIANVFTGNLDSAEIIFKYIYHLADSTGDLKRMNSSRLNLGNFYNNMDKYGIALDYFRQVYPAYVKEKDTLTIAALDQNIGNIHFHQKDYPNALASFRRSYMLYRLSRHGNEAQKLFNSIGFTFLQLNHYDSAAYYLSLGLAFARQQHDRLDEMYVLNNLGMLSAAQGNDDDAVNNYNIALLISREIDYPQQQANYLINIAGVDIKRHCIKEAAFRLKEAAPIVEQVGNQGLYRDLNEQYYLLFTAGKDFEKALYYYQKYTEAKDSIFSRETTNKIAELNIKFETSKKETENIGLKATLELKAIKEKRLVLLAAAISTVLASLIVAFSFIGKYLKQKRTIAEQEALLLKDRLAFSQQELACKAMHLASQSEFKVKLLETTKDVYFHLDESGKESIKTVLRNLESHIDQSAWPEFETRFEKVHDAFFGRLQRLFPDLTPNDRRICAFLKLNMSTKDIALLTHRSPRSIESSRYRLKKKFGLGQEEDILTFLQSV